MPTGVLGRGRQCKTRTQFRPTKNAFTAGCPAKSLKRASDPVATNADVFQHEGSGTERDISEALLGSQAPVHKFQLWGRSVRRHQIGAIVGLLCSREGPFMGRERHYLVVTSAHWSWSCAILCGPAQTSQLCPKEHAVGSVCHGVPWRSDENHTTCCYKDAGCRDADHPQRSPEFRMRRRKEFTKPAPRLAWLRLNSESQYCRSSLAQCLLTRSSWSSSNRTSNAPSSSPVPQSAHGIPASS